jgi:triacylglycerol lipase
MNPSEIHQPKNPMGPPSEILAEILSMGNEFDEGIVEKTTRLYIPLHKEVVQEGIKVTKDLEYGPDDRHRLDVHEPMLRPDSPMPIIAFFHGGGFVGGDKNSVGDLIYGNVPNYFARNGMLGINATYRLAPRHKWPEGAMDVAGVVKWLKENGAKYGGDPEKIFLFGHSAGAAHVATYLFHKELQPESEAGVSGAILMSGQYHLNPNNPRPFDKAYYGEDTGKYADMSAINHLDGLEVPLFIIFAEFDPHQIEMQSVELFEAICKRDEHCPRLTRIRNHNHISEAAHINTSDESIGPEIVEFIKTGR